MKVGEKYISEVHDRLISFIKGFFKDKNGPAVIGISGGKDSTVCAALLAEALGPGRVIGVQMPNGVQKDLADSDKVIETLGIQKKTINIAAAYEGLTKEIIKGYDEKDLPTLYTTNTPARIRMATLYGIAAFYNGFVCNTCNRSEDFVGYSTKWGDAVGDFSLLNDLTVTEVVALGDYMKLPTELVHKTPSDGMCGQSDEDKLGFTYETLDKYLLCQLPPKSLEILVKIEKLHNNPNTALKIVNMAKPFIEDIAKEVSA